MPRRNNGPRLQWLEKRACYYITWTERGRSRQRSAGSADVTEAQLALATFINAQPSRGGPRDPSEVFVTDVLADFAMESADRLMAPKRLARSVVVLTDFWAGRTVQDITKPTCAAYVRWRNKAPGTARRDLTDLRSAVNAAHRDGKLTRTVHVELPQPPPARQDFLTREEAARLLKAALQEPRVRLHLPLFIMVGLYTGQRKEAVLSLRWPSVDLRANRMDFRIAGRRVTKKRRSNIQIPPGLRTHLRNARKRGADLGHVVNENGQALGDIKRSFESARTRAGLRKISPHILRHTCATWMMQLGVPMWEAAGFLAMSLDTLERVYGHHHPDFHEGAANAFSRRPRNVRVNADKTGHSGLPKGAKF